jgi:hypothetical protein
MNNFRTHLSEEQLDDVLMGDAAVEAAGHLVECTACQARVAEMAAPIASFAAVSLAWSERQSATTFPRVVGATGSAWPQRASWALAATCLLLIGFAIPMARHEERGSRTVAATEPRQTARVSAAGQIAAAQVSNLKGRVAVVAATDSSPDAQIAQDNRMLRAIDRELDASVQSPSEAFGPMAVGGRPNGHGRNAPAPSWD